MGSNLHSSASNPFRVVRICIGTLRIPVEWLEFAFECFESFSNGWNLHSNALDPFQVVRNCFGMIRIPSSGSNLDSNTSNRFRIVRMSIRIPF